jgi:hypothetical protein
VSPRLRACSGYAMLAAVLIGTLAAAFALAAVSAVVAAQDVARSDSSSWRAGAASRRALDEVSREARWRPQSPGVAVADPGGERGEKWTATLSAPSPDPGTGWLRRRADVTGAFGSAVRSDSLVLELRTEGWATGFSVAGDAEFGARFAVSGSGLYAGGCVRGRENVEFLAGSGGVTASGLPVDLAHGEIFAAACVHAGASIFAAGQEVHAGELPSAFPDDTDEHAGTGLPSAWVTGPSEELLVAARTRGETPGAALADGVLHLDALADATPDELVAGRCILLPRGDEIVIEGVAAAWAGPLVIIAPDDVVVGVSGAPVEFTGALVVGGRLVLNSGLTVRGTLHAGSLLTESPASLELEVDRRAHPLPGTVQPVVVESAT